MHRKKDHTSESMTQNKNRTGKGTQPPKSHTHRFLQHVHSQASEYAIPKRMTRSHDKRSLNWTSSSSLKDSPDAMNRISASLKMGSIGTFREMFSPSGHVGNGSRVTEQEGQSGTVCKPIFGQKKNTPKIGTTVLERVELRHQHARAPISSTPSTMIVWGSKMNSIPSGDRCSLKD